VFAAGMGGERGGGRVGARAAGCQQMAYEWTTVDALQHATDGSPGTALYIKLYYMYLEGYMVL